MAVLINGNGNKAIYANQDADLIASLVGDQSCISAVGSQMAATAQDANTIAIADGICITKEGRRIQLDNGKTDIFEIPTGESGVTNYYIIGYHLYTEADSSQKCETFVQKMDNSTATITEDTFRGGATDVYVSLYRVTQVGFNISTIAALLVSLANLKGLKSDLSALESDLSALESESGIKAFKISNLVIVHIILSGTTKNAGETIGTVAEGFRPSANKTETGSYVASGTDYFDYFTIHTDGSLTCANGITNGYGEFIFTYLI